MSQKRSPETSGLSPSDMASSETVGIFGVRVRSISRITVSAATSASVTGDLSSFSRTSISSASA